VEIGRPEACRPFSRTAEALERWDDRAIEARCAPATAVRPAEIEGRLDYVMATDR
jgi:hypothetical protein